MREPYDHFEADNIRCDRGMLGERECGFVCFFYNNKKQVNFPHPDSLGLYCVKEVNIADNVKRRSQTHQLSSKNLPLFSDLAGTLEYRAQFSDKAICQVEKIRDREENESMSDFFEKRIICESFEDVTKKEPHLRYKDKIIRARRGE